MSAAANTLSPPCTRANRAQKNSLPSHMRGGLLPRVQTPLALGRPPDWPSAYQPQPASQRPLHQTAKVGCWIVPMGARRTEVILSLYLLGLRKAPPDCLK